MFDIGFLEMMTIGVVALVVIGPERLPAVATKVGRYVGKAQRFVRGVRSDISRELETGDLKKLIGDQKSQIDELRDMMHTASKDIQSSTSSAMKEVEKSVSEAKETAVGSIESAQVENDPEQLSDEGVSSDLSASGDDNETSSEANNKAS